MHNFSSFSDRVKPQPMFSILTEAAALERKGREVIHLEVGDNSIGFDNTILRRKIRETAEMPFLGYCASEGIFDLRTRFAELNTTEKGAHFGPEHVAISPANSLIYQFLAVTCDPGAQVLLPDPGFPSYYLGAEALGLQIVPYPLIEKNGWRADTDFIISALSSGSIKAMLLNNPSNPLGVSVCGDDVSKIIEACVDNDVHVLLDETYKNLVYDGTSISVPHLPGVSYLYSLSKDAAAPALRIGTLVGPENLIRRVNNLSSLLYSCHSPILQQIALSYLNADARFDREIRQVMPKRIEALDQTLSAVPGIRFNSPNSAFYLFVNISEVASDADHFALELLNTTGVCVCPGNGFGPSGRNYVRVNIGVDQDRLDRGIAALASFLMRHSSTA